MAGQVLVIDDDAAVRDAVIAALGDVGLECTPAGDGMEGLRLSRLHPPDAIVLDVRMPGLSGDEVFAALRDHTATRYVPVIFLTAQRTTEDLARRLLEGADDYVAKPFDMHELTARVTAAIRRARRLRELNPLSGLPGNQAIGAELTRRLRDRGPSAFLYCDLDHFKEFNDHYGFARGDQLIVLLSRLCISIAERTPGETFVGHVGGDDFVLVVPEAAAEDVARAIVRGFDDVVPTVYDSDDRARGYIVRADRRGVEMNLPFVTVSIGIVPVSASRFTDAIAVSRAAAEVKEIAKRREGSSWAVDRRQANEGSAVQPVA
ncbi:MAG TPA: response regulator [Candidatus Limnocylindria bacterium]|nr:response regulator [Candidatus Limnocylindria bacterium]